MEEATEGSSVDADAEYEDAAAEDAPVGDVVASGSFYDLLAMAKIVRIRQCGGNRWPIAVASTIYSPSR
jgi:hypothetical protein